MTTDSLVTEIKGVGEKTAALFARLDIHTVGDLLAFYPRTYDQLAPPAAAGAVRVGERCAVYGRIVHEVQMKRVRNLQILTTVVEDPTGKLTLTWFNMPFLKNQLKRGMGYVFRGRVVSRMGHPVMEQPKLYTPGEYEDLSHILQPVYGLTSGLSNHAVQKAMRQVMELPVRDALPEELRDRYHLAETSYAQQKIHFPADVQELTIARRRLVFEEFLCFILSMRRLKDGEEQSDSPFRMKRVWKPREVIDDLPYTLTGAQLRVWQEIERDMTGGKVMSRLIQGDVGSGKTILAFLAMICAAENGLQSALMVPTEVLAGQHYEALKDLLCSQGMEDVQPVLLTGSCTSAEKRRIREKIESGESRMIVGTHALIQESVSYKNLALVITDEQHRFGVRQRQLFSEKGLRPHILVMSATPIPRTLAIILYGDLDISILDERPAKRLPIKNCVVGPDYRPKAWSFIRGQVEEGRQAYVICPMVEPSEVMELANVTEYTMSIKKALPSSVRVEMLHGKMRPEEKNTLMELFSRGEIQVLVSTTVIEVGIDVPNATVMLVENAERFGLAQLHQLRGRVGRGEWQSYCIFLAGQDDEQTVKRLDILNKSNDGFFIAAEDLKLRGPGDFFGVRQSGEQTFILADVTRDGEILAEAAAAAGELLALDGTLSLPQHEPLREKLDTYRSRVLYGGSI